jgi:hypothetical protein
MKSQPNFGGVDWIEWVYSTPEVRDPRGRNRPTQRFKPFCRALGKEVCAEGGNELTVLLLLDILHACGVVKRFKLQPFELQEDVHGVSGIPDFMVEGVDGTHHVPEVKSSRFYTLPRIQTAARVERFLAQFNLRYAVWETDLLGPEVWHNVRQVRRHGVQPADPDAAVRLRDAVGVAPVSFDQLIDAGHDVHLLMHETWEGHVHFNLLERRNGSTKLYAQARPEFYLRLFGSGSDFDRWWAALPNQ